MPRLKNKYILEDVTQEFLSKSTPGKGRIIFEEGFNHKRNYKEEETAKWLLETFGGEIIVLNERRDYKISNPDFDWNSHHWELKGITTTRAIDNGIRKAIKQIYYNPGGIIIDVSKSKTLLNSLIKIIENRMNLYRPFSIYIIIKNKYKLIKVIKKKIA